MSLEQIDEMDYRRLSQALAAQSILDVEGRRSLLMRGVIKEVTDDEAERIARHDELVGATAEEGENDA